MSHLELLLTNVISMSGRGVQLSPCPFAEPTRCQASEDHSGRAVTALLGCRAGRGVRPSAGVSAGSWPSALPSPGPGSTWPWRQVVDSARPARGPGRCFLAQVDGPSLFKAAAPGSSPATLSSLSGKGRAAGPQLPRDVATGFCPPAPVPPYSPQVPPLPDTVPGGLSSGV